MDMKAWVLDEEGSAVRLAEVDDPQPRAGTAVVEVLAAQVPAYTEALTTGGRGMLSTPLVLGPSCIGRVAAVGEDVFHLAVGDVVVDTALLSSGEAVRPEQVIVGWTGVGGRGEATERVAAMRRAWPDGTFAQAALVPGELLVVLPGAGEHPHPEKLVFLGWLAVAAQGLERAGQGPGDVVAVIGATGQMGGAAVLVALAQGASRVVAVGRSRPALERLAAIDPRVVTVALSGERTADAAAITQTSGGGCDVVLDALGPTPTAEATMAGYDSVAVDGSMVLIGGVRQDLVIPYGDLMRRRLALCGSWMATAATTLRMWSLVRSGLVDLDVLDVAVVDLDDPAAALERAAATSGLAIVTLAPRGRPGQNTLFGS